MCCDVLLQLGVSCFLALCLVAYLDGSIGAIGTTCSTGAACCMLLMLHVTGRSVLLFDMLQLGVSCLYQFPVLTVLRAAIVAYYGA